MIDLTLYRIDAVLFTLLFGFLLGVSIYGFWYGLHRSGREEDERRMRITRFVGILLVWVVLTGVLAYTGFFRDFDAVPPRFPMLVLPPFILVIWLSFSRYFAPVLKALPLFWLTLIQGFRIVVEIILWLGAEGGFVPPQMTFEGLNFDILSGILAIPVAFLVFKRRVLPTWVGLVYHLIGLALLPTIITVAILSLPVFGVFTPPNLFVSELPFVWLPAFVVPFALALHLFALRKLLKGT